MPAETLNCPMCGAPQTTDATRCEHCGARLATVACPSCFGMMFVGAKFCSHCGARAQREEGDAEKELKCPRCAELMNAVTVGASNLRECPRCEGLWVDADTLKAICADREQQAAVLGMANHLPASDNIEPEQKIRYLPCPECRKLMNRVNFAHCSHVVVDVCSKHGTWFDKDELRRIVEFIRAGGMEAARQREIDELEQRKRETQSAGIASAWNVQSDTAPPRDGFEIGLSAAADMLKWLFK
jgi:Zn-finger nucleic acid-binding protein